MSKYRVTINGFWCHNETWDDALNWDGKHDEVFFSVNTKVSDASGTVKQNLDSESELMGDTWNLPGRVQAGSASDRGGIVTGDKYPTATPWLRNIAVDGRRFPPYTVYEGDPGADMVLLTPTIWEWDPGTGFWDGWLAWQVQTDAKYGQRAKDIFSKIWPVAAPVFDAVSLGIQTAGTLQGLWSPVGRSQRRPVGLTRDPDNPDGALFNPATIALNQDTAAYLTDPNTGNLQGLGVGIIEIRYVDDPFLRGVYSIFLQVERLNGNGGPATWPDGSVVRESSDPAVYVIFGNAKFWVSDPRILDRLYGGWGVVRVTPDGSLATLDSTPDDGTILKEENDPFVWRIEGGQKRHVTTPALLSGFGGWAMVRIVPDGSLALLPVGAPID
jgi:hypothetical protein